MEQMNDLLTKTTQFQQLAHEINQKIQEITREFQLSLERERKQTEEEIQRLNNATTATAKELENKLLKLQEKIEPFQEVISLNVGGTIFITSLRTISSPKSGVLHTMFSGKIPIPPMINGAYFLDRNPAIFSLIIDFLRGCDVVARYEDRTQLLALYDEAKFFEIEELIERIEAKLKIRAPPPPQAAPPPQPALVTLANPRVLHISNQDQYSPSHEVLIAVGIQNLTTVRQPPPVNAIPDVDSILVTTWSTVDTTLLGNFLVAAVDRGITVVICEFAQSTGFTFPQGRFLAENYYAITAAPCENTNGSLGRILFADHPLFAGIATITQGTDKRRCSGALAPGAELLAQWEDGKPFIAIRNDRRGLVISTTAQFGQVGVQQDGMRLLKNALSLVKR